MLGRDRTLRTPPTLGDLKPAAGPRVPNGHSLTVGSFCFGDRCLEIQVDFGGQVSNAALERRVGDVLASVSVENHRAQSQATRAHESPRGCPRPNWSGPWSKCAEARWVERVTEQAGYRVVGDTGSALMAEGRGAEFAIWTTLGQRPIAEVVTNGDWRRLGTSGGRAIYGDDHLWRVWQAQGFIFWLQAGPTATSKPPTLGDLERLVEASATVAPPR